MTKKQHRKNKQKQLSDKTTHPSVCSERPEWANDETREQNKEEWRLNFLKEVKESIKMREKSK